MSLLSPASSQIAIIDVQERLAPAIAGADAILRATLLLVAAANRLGVPVSATEQYPKGLGPSVAPLRHALGNGAAIFEKIDFSAMRAELFASHLARQGRNTLLLCGMEAHVCVLQTAIEAQAAGYDAVLVTDAIGSRAPHSVDIALRRMERAGIRLVTSEMVVFEWIGRAGSEDFKALAPLLK